MARRALLCDLDGVLRLWDPEVERRAEEAGGLGPGSLRRAAFAPDLLAAAVTGRLADGAWRERVAARLQAEHPGSDAAGAVRAWSAPAGRVDRHVLALVRACRPAAAVVLVTNATTRLPRDLARLGLEREFDAVVSSAEVGAAKPSAEIFAAALAAAGVVAGAALFVDDAAANVAGAAALGIPGHLYRGAAALADRLRACGFLGGP